MAGVDDSLVDRVVRGMALVAGGRVGSRLVFGLGLGVAGAVVAAQGAVVLAWQGRGSAAVVGALGVLALIGALVIVARRATGCSR